MQSSLALERHAAAKVHRELGATGLVRFAMLARALLSRVIS